MYLVLCKPNFCLMVPQVGILPTAADTVRLVGKGLYEWEDTAGSYSLYNLTTIKQLIL